MTLTAPPRPPQPGDPLEHEEIEDPEALIEEARQRTRRRRRRYGALALAAGATAGLSFYFGFAGGGTSARPIDALASPPAPAPVAAYPGYFELWFWRGGCCGLFPTWRTAAELGISPEEDIHTRTEINGPDENRRATDLLERALTSLIAGPTPADIERVYQGARDADYPEGFQWDLVTGLPPNVQLLGVTLSNGIATIDIASELLEPPSVAYDSYNVVWGEFRYLQGTRRGEDVLAQLILTATQFPFVDGVLFKLDGQPVKAQIWDAPSDTWELVGRPVTRADYEHYMFAFKRWLYATVSPLRTTVTSALAASG
jgi:Sporulation and spore germination